ncbi:MAG: flagellar biosynthesis protein FliQ [Rhodospirillaceae bacterium]|nr:flagellar biosynthesis protein FliQ [Rhodospirillaceae bacterium]
MGMLEVIDIGREALSTALTIAAPVMVIALITGLSIALFQALTQIQEMTLTFVPKIIVMFVAIMILLPFMLTTLIGFTQGIFDRISAFGA